MKKLEEVPETTKKIREDAKKTTIYGSPKGGEPTNKPTKTETGTIIFNATFPQEQPPKKNFMPDSERFKYLKVDNFKQGNYKDYSKKKADRYAGKPNTRNDEGGYCL